MKSDFADEVRRKRQQQRADATNAKARKDGLDTVSSSGDRVADAVKQSTAKIVGNEPRVEVKNPDLAKTADIDQVVESINQLNLTTFIASKDSWTDVVENLSTLAERMQGVVETLRSEGVKKIESGFANAVTNLQAVATQLKSVKVETDTDLTDAIAELNSSFQAVNWSPSVKVPAPKVTVERSQLDLTPLQAVLEGLDTRIQSLGANQPELDLSEVTEGLDGVEKAVRDLIARPIPVPETPLPFKNTLNEGVQSSAIASTSDSTKTGIVVVNPDGSNISGGGGGSVTQYAEDTASAAAEQVMMAGAVRKDTGASLVDTDGDRTELQVDSTGNLRVNIAAGSSAGTEYTEDAAAPANPNGGAVSLRRKDSLASEVTTDGDWVTANATAKGELYVKQTDAVPVTQSGTWDEVGINDSGNSITVDDGAGSLTVDGTVSVTGVSTLAEQQTQTTSLQLIDDVVYTDDTSTHATGTSKGVGIMATAVPTDTAVNANDIGMVGMTTDRRMYVDASGVAVPVTDNGGNISIDDGGNSITVDGTVTASIAAGATTVAKAEDVASADADVGIPAMAVRKGTPANTSGTDGDYEMLQISAGRLWTSTTVDAALPAGANAIGKLAANSGVDIGDVDVTSLTPGTGATNLGKAEDAPHNSGDTGIMSLGVRNDAGSAFGADGDYVPISIDASGAVRVTGGGGGTQYTEDAAAAADPTGNAMIMVRKDTLAALTSTDGDNVAARGTDKGELYVKHADTIPVTDNGGSLTVDGTVSVTGVSTLAEQQTQTTSLQLIDDAIVADDAAFTPATTKVMMSGFEFDDAAPDSVNEGDAGAARMSANRNVYTTVRDAAGNERGANVNASSQLSVSVDNTVTVGSHAVTNAGTFAVQVDGNALTALQLIDDPVATLGTTTYTEATTKGNIIGAVRRDADTTLVDTTNEVAPLQVDSRGALKVEAFSGEALPITDNSGSLTVDYATTGSGTAAGALRVELPTNGTGVVGLNAGTNAIGKLAANSGVDIGDVDVTTIAGVAPAFNTGTRSATTQRVTIATDDVVPASQSGTWTVQPGNTANTTPWLVTDSPATTGGLSKFHLVGAATDNATNVKASAGQVYAITAFNLNASPRYLKFHNTAGTPTAGTGVTDTYLIPGNTAGAGLVINIDKGIAFGTGIGITIVTGIADNNTTAISASEVVVNIYYK